jgi:hypothetical protein
VRRIGLVVGCSVLFFAAVGLAAAQTFSGSTSQPSRQIALTVQNGRVSRVTLTFNCPGQAPAGVHNVATSFKLNRDRFSGTITRGAVSVNLVGTLSRHEIKGSFTATLSGGTLGGSCSPGKVNYTARVVSTAGEVEYSGATSQPSRHIALTIQNGWVRQVTLTFNCPGQAPAGVHNVATSFKLNHDRFSGTITRGAVSVNLVGTLSKHEIKGSFTATASGGTLGGSCSPGDVTYTAVKR